MQSVIYSNELENKPFVNEYFNKNIHTFLVQRGFSFTAKSERYWLYLKDDFKIRILSSDLQELVIIDTYVEGIGWISYCQFTCPFKLNQFEKILQAYGLERP